MDVAATVDALIARSGMPQSRAAALAGIDEARLGDVRVGKAEDITVDEADRLAVALGVSLTDFALMAFGELPLPSHGPQTQKTRPPEGDLLRRDRRLI